MMDLINEFVILTADIDAAEVELKAKKARRKDLEKQIAEEFGEAGIQNISLADGPTVYRTIDTFVNVPNDMQPVCMNWLKQQGWHDDVVETKVTTSKLKSRLLEAKKEGDTAIMKEIVEAGAANVEEVPAVRCRKN